MADKYYDMDAMQAFYDELKSHIPTIVGYGTCGTAAATATKEVTITDPNFVQKVGSVIGIKFTNTNTASNVKIKVNNYDAYPIFYNNAVYTSNGATYTGNAGRIIYYMFDGTYWVWKGVDWNTADGNTIPSVYCTTVASATAKVGQCTNYKVNANVKTYGLITITTANTAANALTLNINSQGAKPLYLNGSATNSTNYDIPAGMYLFYWDGTNYYINTDGTIPFINSNIQIGTDLKNNAGVISVNTDGTVGNSAEMPFVAGSGTYASGIGAAAFGWKTSAVKNYSFAEGYNTTASGEMSHAEGANTIAGWIEPGGEGPDTPMSACHAEGMDTRAFGMGSHAEGGGSTAWGNYSHAEGLETYVNGNYAHAEGWGGTAQGNNSHAEGFHTFAWGSNTHSEGKDTTAKGSHSHAEGSGSSAAGEASHAEGAGSSAFGNYSHAQGYNNFIASDSKAAHVGGTWNSIAGEAYYNSNGSLMLDQIANLTAWTSAPTTLPAKLESYSSRLYPGGSTYSSEFTAQSGSQVIYGMNNTAIGRASMAIGYGNVAYSPYTFVAGKGNMARDYGQAVVGNWSQYTEYGRFVVGVGTANNNRKNGFVVTDKGISTPNSAYIENGLQVTGTNVATGNRTGMIVVGNTAGNCLLIDNNDIQAMDSNGLTNLDLNWWGGLVRAQNFSANNYLGITTYNWATNTVNDSTRTQLSSTSTYASARPLYSGSNQIEFSLPPGKFIDMTFDVFGWGNSGGYGSTYIRLGLYPKTVTSHVNYLTESGNFVSRHMLVHYPFEELHSYRLVYKNTTTATQKLKVLGAITNTSTYGYHEISAVCVGYHGFIM